MGDWLKLAPDSTLPRYQGPLPESSLQGVWTQEMAEMESKVAPRISCPLPASGHAWPSLSHTARPSPNTSKVVARTQAWNLPVPINGNRAANASCSILKAASLVLCLVITCPR